MWKLQALILWFFAVACAYPFDLNLDRVWKIYKLQFGKNYSNEENGHRRLVWEQAVNETIRHNLEADLRIHSHRLGLNTFTDKTNKEYLSFLTRQTVIKSSTCYKSVLPQHKTPVPNEVDWRTKGIVPAVKNQGQCGSASIMAAVSCMESQHAKKTGHLISLSIQNLIDCCGSEGCDGGFSADEYFLCIEKMGGIDSTASYPSGKEGVCKFNKSGIAAKCRGCVDLPSGNEEALKIAVATVGPVTTVIDASNFDFQLYSDGIYDNPDCSSTELDHSLLIIGYGTEDGKDYWLLQNSWGANWGMNGYIKMSRNKDNQCGIATFASYPLV